MDRFGLDAELQRIPREIGEILNLGSNVIVRENHRVTLALQLQNALADIIHFLFSCPLFQTLSPAVIPII